MRHEEIALEVDAWYTIPTFSFCNFFSFERKEKLSSESLNFLFLPQQTLATQPWIVNRSYTTSVILKSAVIIFWDIIVRLAKGITLKNQEIRFSKEKLAPPEKDNKREFVRI